MLHNSDDHREHVSFCWNFQRGVCDYKNNCWFIHEKKDIIIDKFKIQNKFIKTEGKNLNELLPIDELKIELFKQYHYSIEMLTKHEPM